MAVCMLALLGSLIACMDPRGDDGGCGGGGGEEEDANEEEEDEEAWQHAPREEGNRQDGHQEQEV